MLLLTVLASFGMFVVILLIGVAIGYALGYKNEKTLRQQISKLKSVVRSQNKSAQLKELTTAELKQRDDWDFRARLAELTNISVDSPATPTNNDPHSMENTF